MNNDSEDISKKSIAQIIKELKPGQLKALIIFLIIILSAFFSSGYWIGSATTTSKSNDFIKQKPEFNFTIIEIEQDIKKTSFYTICTFQNTGNINGTEVQGEIKSNIELKYVYIGKGNMTISTYYNGKIKGEGNKIYKFYCKILHPKEYVDIRFKTNKSPKLKLININCDELK